MKFSEVAEHVISDIQSEMNGYNVKYPKYRKRVGKIGELIIGRTIKYTLFSLNFKPYDMGGACTFNIERQLGATDNEEEGVDFGVTVNDAKNRKHIYLIEVKNWSGRYKVSKDLFKKEILSRYQRIDKEHNTEWVLAIKRNIYEKYIGPLCKDNNISVIHLDTHLTSKSNRYEILESVINDFMRGFTELLYYDIENIECEKLIQSDDESDRMEEIKEYIKIHLPDRIIRKKFNLTESHLSKIKSELRQKGFDIVDTRTKRAEHFRKL